MKVLLALMVAAAVCGAQDRVGYRGCDVLVCVQTQGREPIPGAVVLFDRYPGIPLVTNSIGLAKLSTPQCEDGPILLSTSFAVDVAATGYAPRRMTFSAPETRACEDRLCIYRVVTLYGAQASSDRPQDPKCGQIIYSFISWKAVPCKQSSRPSLLCIDYVDGKPTGKVDWTNEHAQKKTTTAKVDGKLDDELSAKIGELGGSISVSVGAGNSSESTISVTTHIDIAIGSTEFPGKCGEVCINLMESELVMRRRIVECVNGTRTIRDLESVTRRIVTGYCIAAYLTDCDKKK